MTQPLQNFSVTSTDWRKSLQTNNRKTVMIITLFISIYVCVGLLVDMFMLSASVQHATLSQLFMYIITLQYFPIATVIMIVIATISLLVTFSFSDQLMLLGTEYRQITPETAQTNEEKQFYNIVEEIKIAAGLSYMPKVYIIEADYMNAFASGYSEKSAMVAITRGLLLKLNRSEIQAVMAHEISHVRHMDIKVTLMASVLANLIVMVLDMMFYSVVFSNQRSDSDNRSRNSLATILIILRYLLPIINILLLLYLSRTREYMADAGSVELLRDNQPLANALLKIEQDHTDNKAVYSSEYAQTAHENVRRAAYIFDPVQAGIEPMTSIADAFSTHPNLKDRLAAIGIKFKNS
ncbi:MAG: zinc metalloprotease HtpX [Gammaproteobacteria bacterium]|nr:zinc metalloprotease HtpX [Gammaproteobacteria bacterium]